MQGKFILMTRKLLTIVGFCGIMAMYSCSRRSHPARSKATTETSRGATENTTKETDTATVRKAVVKKKAPASIPKVIVVNDNAARKSVDGRLYYDMLGHRYWRNYNDGKYYLFNKSMFNDPAFKPK